MSTDRLETFSDGVFAIAITLLILDIQVPHVEQGHLAHALVKLWPSYTTFVVSFLTIGIIWVNHHTQYEHIVRADRTLLFLNLNLLMWIVFIPFPTALLAEYLRGGEDQHVAAAVYSGVLFVMGISFFIVWFYAARRGLLAEQLTRDTVRRLVRRNAIGEIAYAAAIAIAFVSAPVSLAICGLVALYYVFPGKFAGERFT